ncbi:hypothetical protein [Leptospira weilii]|uniref:hypothetical protein n=1 Tax=Leptospira weilii TaxID=28184 RepID=UPI0002BF2F01|nr:hypothetical protein [Leptospira weilii]EMN45676.1 hypothetical protein LEP1GSC086_2465 [Leptospira weilii str. LNT 1234]
MVKKQSEITKLVTNIVRKEGSKYSWKYAYGFLFRKIGDLYFDISILGVKGGFLIRDNDDPLFKKGFGKLCLDLNYKWYEFDNLFWEIIGSSKYIKKPMSYHSSCGHQMRAMELVGYEIPIDVWEEKKIETFVSNFLEEADTKILEESSKVTSIEKYLPRMEELYANFLIKYPRALVEIHAERFFCALLTQDYEWARQILVEVNTDNPVGRSDGRDFWRRAKVFKRKIERANVKLRKDLNS